MKDRRLSLFDDLILGLVLVGVIGAALHWQRARRESEARWQAALRGSLDGFFVLQAVRAADGTIVDFQILEVNDVGCALMGLTREASVGRSLFELFPNARNSVAHREYEQVIASRQAIESEFENPTPNMPTRWLHHQVVPLGDGVAVTTRDVTARREADEVLRASEARFRTLAMASPVGILQADTRGNCACLATAPTNWPVWT